MHYGMDNHHIGYGVAQLGELKTLIVIALVLVFVISVLHVRDGQKIKRLHDDRPKPTGDGGNAINKGDAR